MNDPLDLKQFIRTVNDFPIKGVKFRDITSLIENPIAFRLTCDELTKNYKKTLGCIAIKKKDMLILLRLINKNTKIKIN